MFYVFNFLFNKFIKVLTKSKEKIKLKKKLDSTWLIQFF